MCGPESEVGKRRPHRWQENKIENGRPHPDQETGDRSIPYVTEAPLINIIISALRPRVKRYEKEDMT